MKFSTRILLLTLTGATFIAPVSEIAASPADSNAPSSGKPNSGLAEKGKPTSDQTSVNCSLIGKNTSKKEEVGSSNDPSAGRGQFPTACLPKSK